MNKSVKILIAVISACCAFILVYFLISKINDFKHDHPKDVGMNSSQIQNYTIRVAHSGDSSGNNIDSMNQNINSTTTLENLELHKNYKLFNNERCGVQTGVHKIHNGKVTKLKGNPWMVALVYFNKKTNATSVDCAGTLISENLVLTAAHCLTRKPIALRLGDYNLVSDPDCVTFSDGKTECADKVQEITDFTPLIHKFHFKQIFDDIALIRLNEPAKLEQNNINTICLPFGQEPVSVYDNLIITGWGRIDNNNTFSDVLLYTHVNYIPNEECSKTITSTLTKFHMCAGADDGSDSCRGDSGGPLTKLSYYNNKIRAIQYGIVSYGPSGDCGKGPGVYTNIPKYLDWILENATS